LSIALTSSREIGAALGVLMCQHRLTNEDAFSVLRIVSQYTHRKLRDVAAELVFTGALDAPTMAQALSQLRS
jgi:AmiR/NasT family two-component response regulator